MTDPYTDETERQQDLSHYVRVLRRRKLLIAGMTVLVTALAIVFSVRQASVYRATTQVLLNRQDLVAAVTGRTDPSLSEDPARLAATQAALARSHAVAQLAIKSARVRNLSAGALLASSSVTPNPNADILVFTVDDSDARHAAVLANSYAAAYSAYRFKLDATALQNARAELTGRIAALRSHGDQNSVLYKTLVSSEQQLHTMELLQSQDTVLSQASLGGKVKPTPKRDGLLGLGFGLLLGVGAAFFLEALDKRIRAEDDVERELGLPLLGRLPEPSHRLREKLTLIDDPARRLRKLGLPLLGRLPEPPRRLGEKLTMIDEPMSAQADAVRKLATNIRFSSPDHPAQVLMVTSAVQREGKSTTASNLAVALARSGHAVVVVDLDLREPSIASLFNVHRLAGLTNVVMRQATLDDALVPIPLPNSEPMRRTDISGSDSLSGRLSVLPTGPLPANPGEFIGAKALVARVLEPLRKKFDYVIVDAPPMCVGGDAMTLSGRVDSLIVVTRLGVIDRAALSDLRRQLTTCPTRVIGFVLTGVDAPRGYSYGMHSANGNESRYELRPPGDLDTVDEPRRARF